MTVLSTLMAREAFGDMSTEGGKSLYEGVELTLSARLRDVKDRVSVALAQRAEFEGGVTHWPPASPADHRTWAMMVQELHAEIADESIRTWTELSRRINSVEKAEAVLFVAAESDAQRVDRKENPIELEQDDEAMEHYCFVYDTYTTDGASALEAEEEAEPDDDDDLDYGSGEVDDRSSMISANGGPSNDEMDTEPEPDEEGNGTMAVGTTGGPLVRGTQDENDLKRPQKEKKLSAAEKYEKWRGEFKASAQAAKAKQEQVAEDAKKRDLAAHMPPFSDKKAKKSEDPLERALFEHNELLTDAVQEYCLALFEILSQAVAEGYQRFPPVPKVPALTTFPVESAVKEQFTELLNKHQLDVSEPHIYEEACYVAQTDCAVWMVQIAAARDDRWKNAYEGSIRPHNEDGDWDPLGQAAETLKSAQAIVPAIFEAHRELPSRLQFLHGFLQQTVLPGLCNAQVDNRPESFLERAEIAIGLDDMQKQDPKHTCLDEFAAWLVTQSQDGLAPEIYRRGLLIDLSETVLHSVIWATRQAQRSLFDEETFLSANKVIEKMIVPMVMDFLQRFQEKVISYEPDMVATDQATIEFQAQASKQAHGEATGDAEKLASHNEDLADEAFAFADHLLLSDGKFGTVAFAALIEGGLARIVLTQQHARRLGSFVAHVAGEAIRLHLHHRARWLDTQGLVDGILCADSEAQPSNVTYFSKKESPAVVKQEDVQLTVDPGAQLTEDLGAGGLPRPGGCDTPEGHGQLSEATLSMDQVLTPIAIRVDSGLEVKEDGTIGSNRRPEDVLPLILEEEESPHISGPKVRTPEKDSAISLGASAPTAMKEADDDARASMDNLPFEPGVVENETVAPHQGAFESDDIALACDEEDSPKNPAEKYDLFNPAEVFNNHEAPKESSKKITWAIFTQDGKVLHDKRP